ncbi:MAG: thioredoxin family protein [Candidatus Bathyarchaeota archaeon]|nr:MAG: thioredoxin family protein [Candidatus Bathyarchaeota archaeon]
MSIGKIEFSRLEKNIKKTGKSYLEYLAPAIGKVYVMAITRDGCPACANQKPKMEKLAEDLESKHKNKALFTQIHVKYSRDSEEESLKSKEVFRHYFYPTNLILLRTRDRGAFEYYRGVSPRMSELRRNIEDAIEISTHISKEG